MSMNCLVTESLDVPEETNFPPSIESTSDSAQNQIIDLAEFEGSAELALDVTVRDPNVMQTLDLQVLLDGDNVSQANQNQLQPTGEVERPLRIVIPTDRLGSDACRRIELYVSSGFVPGSTRPRADGDIGTAVWWVDARAMGGTSTVLERCPR